MEKRYACFELLTNCHKCGNPVPVNGPYEELICPSCSKSVRIPTETLAGFLNDFDEEYTGYEAGQGSGGTMIGGGGSFEYGYWLLEPRCMNCKKPLPEHDLDTDEKAACESCSTDYYVFPVSEAIQEIAPSAKQFISFEQPQTKAQQEALTPDESELKPIVMSCPKCGGALSVTKMSERIMTCEYCTTEVYVPDAVWQRLHPVKEKTEWFVRFEGKTITQMAVSRRRRDLKEENAEIKERKAKQRFSVKKKPKIVKYLIIGLLAIIALMVFIIALMDLLNYTQDEIEKMIGRIFSVLLIIGFVFITAAGALHAHWGFWFGKQKSCKQALAKLAEKHDWKHWGSKYMASMGYIKGKLKGREFEIDPNDDYAVEVELDRSPFYLKTERPAYPGDELYRFTTGNERFDALFPIRYAKSKIVRKIESSEDFKARFLEPFIWFLDRWEKQLAVAKIDWSQFGVHLLPGYAKTDFSAGRFLLPRQIEPLLEDMLTFVKALEAVLLGKEPNLGD